MALGCEYQCQVPAGSRTLSECFEVFDTIHKVTTNLRAVRRITIEVLACRYHLHACRCGLRWVTERSIGHPKLLTLNLTCGLYEHNPFDMP